MNSAADGVDTQPSWEVSELSIIPILPLISAYLRIPRAALIFRVARAQQVCDITFAHTDG